MSTKPQAREAVHRAPRSSLAFARPGLLQRRCACGGTPGPTGECAECRTKRLQRHSKDRRAPSEAPPIVHDVLRSPGQPLDARTRALMEPRFGHDFGRVRVHTDARASASAKTVNALAYTVGQDVVFKEGEYQPGTDVGRRLLAHELTHVIQQASATQPVLQRKIDEISQDGCAFSIKMGIGIYGSRANTGLASQWQDWINTQWSNEVRCPDGKNACPVTMDAAVTSYSTAARAREVPETNKVLVAEPGYRSKAFGWRGKWAEDEDELSIAHETGHLMGLIDRYWYVGSLKTMRGFENDIMGDYYRDPGPTEFHGALARVLARRGKACPCCDVGPADAQPGASPPDNLQTPDIEDPFESPPPLPDPDGPDLLESASDLRAGGESTPTVSVAIAANSIGPATDDLIHGPLLEGARDLLGRVPGAPQLPDAALKYSGALGRFGRAQWAAPTFSRRNLAEVWFTSRVLNGNPLGLTTPIINDRPIKDNLDVSQAIPLPQINSRAQGGTTRCWFASGINPVGRTHMDILTDGPWTHTATKAEGATRLAREAQTVPNLLTRLAPCRSGTGDVTVRVTGVRGDAAMEAYIRHGEAEHDVDMQRAFEQDIGRMAANVNSVTGGLPELEMAGKDEADCRANLLAHANREDLAIQFVLDVSAAGARRHAGGRHSPDVGNVTVNPDCSAATVTLRHINI